MKKIVLLLVLFLGMSCILDKTDANIKIKDENDYLAKTLIVMKDIGYKINESNMLYVAKISLNKFINVAIDGVNNFDKTFFEPLTEVFNEEIDTSDL